MKMLYVERKGQMPNTLENYCVCVYIYMVIKQGLQMNEALTDTYNPVFDILIKANSNTHNPPTHKTQPIPGPSTPLTPFPPHPPNLPSLFKLQTLKHNNLQ
jgi:hypothetical protein